MNNPLISIIIPIYNVEKYLESSVKSAINQTYKNIEIILVDDGSPDNCPQICDELKKTDERIKVIHKKNGGLSDARNYGIKEAVGEFIFFLDSDDTMANNAIEICLNIALSESADVVLSNCFYRTYEVSEKKEIRYHFSENDFCFTPSEFVTNIIIGKGRAWRATGILYRTGVIVENQCTFPIGKISEDIVFNLHLYSCAKKIAFCTLPLIDCLQREGSITKTFHKDFFDTILFIDNEVKCFFEKNNIDNNIANKKQNSLFCRNVIVYMLDIVQKNNGLSMKEKKSLYNNIIYNPRFQEAMKTKMETPYFQNKYVGEICVILQRLLRKRMYNIAYFFMQLINCVR